MAVVDFYKLERPVQDRFADATRGIGVPIPILHVPPVERRHLAWFAGALTAVAAGVALIVTGFGELDHRWAIAPLWHLAVVGFLFALGAFSVLKGLATLHNLRARPYRPGLYLFPAGVIDARSDPLVVHRIPDVTAETDPKRGTIALSAAGHRYRFSVGGAERVSEAEQTIEEARNLFDRALVSSNRREQALLDPLVDSGFSSPFSPKLPIKKRVPAWITLSPLIALCVGVALSAGIWTVRNRLSERVLYADAKKADTIAAYERYLERGGERAEIRDILLPRAELQQARDEGTVEAIERYLEAHPDSKIESEIRAALRSALDVELERAKATGTVSALRQFAERRKAHAYVDKPVQLAIKERYREAVRKFIAASNPNHADAASLVERLVAYARDHSPLVNVRWVRSTSESLKTADAQVRMSAYFMGPASMPSQYFRAKHAERREKATNDILIPRLQSVFPKEILNFTAGPPIEDFEGSLPEVDVPTLFIRTTPNLAGGYMSTKPRGVFVGVGMMIEGTFVIPDGGPPLVHKASSWRTPNLAVFREEGADVGDVYEDMAMTGYERFARSLLRYLFKDEPELEPESSK